MKTINFQLNQTETTTHWDDRTIYFGSPMYIGTHSSEPQPRKIAKILETRGEVWKKGISCRNINKFTSNL